ncbi:transcriptional regulator, AraC family with amidase-like domain [Desulfocicer vacuolatum DSM 3385]|uniref:Transcriptional regulator, AraC family with amidase-like domain n=1 Tax=Desulfocicer vacuolatum DSM 3385 TaxID=1121400 RepID=A0A1W2EG22_9BACT|nr:GlxA family transcriptional regulator [Desulfocicer vacuolatum]SMD08653.1 transcriptional regulator, AraC family with amidase-like domain [Desulfocicer vacuolatum DSM 3385]
MPHITLLAYPHCSMSSIIGPIDAFAMANLCHRRTQSMEICPEPLFSWDIVSLDGEIVEGYGRVIIQPHQSIHGIKTTDFILIPGFLPPLDFMGKIPRTLIKWFQRWHHGNAMIGASCTGTFFLAETGLLDGKVATTNWEFVRYFQRCYPHVQLKPERILTEDGGLICSGATTSFLDLSLFLIEKFGSEELAAHCGKALLVEPNRRNQSPYVVFDYQKNHSDEKILLAQNRMEKCFEQAIPLDALASDLGISPRHFKRRFKKATGDSPLTYLQRVRIEAAKRKLETTMENITEITWQVGYEDSNSFRRLFRKYTGLSPREYRERFSRAS